MDTETKDETETVTYFTFGMKYAQEEHPLGFDRVHPDGWWEVVGMDRAEARDIVFALTNGQFAFDYADGDFTKALYSKGCTYRITGEVV